MSRDELIAQLQQLPEGEVQVIVKVWSPLGAEYDRRPGTIWVGSNAVVVTPK